MQNKIINQVVCLHPRSDGTFCLIYFSVNACGVLKIVDHRTEEENYFVDNFDNSKFLTQ